MIKTIREIRGWYICGVKRSKIRNEGLAYMWIVLHKKITYLYVLGRDKWDIREMEFKDNMN